MHHVLGILYYFCQFLGWETSVRNTALIQIGFLWVVTPCSVMVGYQCGNNTCLSNAGILPQNTWSHNTEEIDLNFHRRENLKSSVELPLYHQLLIVWATVNVRLFHISSSWNLPVS